MRAGVGSLNVLEEAVNTLRARLRDVQGQRSAFIAAEVPAAYQQEFARVNGDLRALMGRAIVSYARANGLAPGGVEPERLLRIMGRGQPPLDLVAAGALLSEAIGA